MALTQTEKYTVLSYLGWPPLTIVAGSTSFSNFINSLLTGFPTDCEILLRDLLGRIADIDTKLAVMVSRSNVKSIDDIEFFEGGTSELRRERTKVVRELSCMVDIRLGPNYASGFCVSI